MRRAPRLFLRGCGPVLASKRVYQGAGASQGRKRLEIPKPTRMPAGVRPGLTTRRVGAAQRAQSRGDVARLAWGSATGAAEACARKAVRTLERSPSGEGAVHSPQIVGAFHQICQLKSLLQMAAFSCPGHCTHFP